MKLKFYIILFFCALNGLWAQNTGLDNRNIKGTAIPSDNPNPNSYKLEKNEDKPKTVDLANPLEKPKPFSMIEDTNLRSANEVGEKHIKKEQEKIERIVESAYGKVYETEQHLGEFKVKGDFISILCRDYGDVDGDRIKIIVNGEVVASNIFLPGSFKGILVDLKKGLNEISFVALNEGSMYPNTAQFKVFDDKNNFITSNQWSLTRGAKATIFVFNE